MKKPSRNAPRKIIGLTLSICLLLVSGSFALLRKAAAQMKVEAAQTPKKIADIENDASAFKSAGRFSTDGQTSEPDRHRHRKSPGGG